MKVQNVIVVAACFGLVIEFFFLGYSNVPFEVISPSCFREFIVPVAEASTASCRMVSLPISALCDAVCAVRRVV